MRAAILTQRPLPGTLPDVLELADIAEPTPRPRDVVVRVLASTINIDDLHVAEGTFYGGLPIGKRPRKDRPVTPGCDLAGIVVSVGEKVRSVGVGDAVFGVQTPFHVRGAWAEICAVDERWIAKKPGALSFDQAAACGLSGLVAFSAIHALHLRTGSRVVVVGATGGIGSLAVQLAVRAGAEVIGVCGPTNFERAYQLGCSRVIDYHGEEWDRRVREKNDRPVECVLDLVGGGDIEDAARRLLGRKGEFVTVVGPKRFIGDQPLGWFGVLEALSQVGFRTIASRIRGPRYTLAGPGLSGGSGLAEVAAAAGAGVLPMIDSRVPFELEPMRAALLRAARHLNHGRIVIQMDKTKDSNAIGAS